MLTPQSHSEVKRPSQAAWAQALPPPRTAFQGVADLSGPRRKSLRACSYFLCLFARCDAFELDEFKSRPRPLPLFAKHCYLEQAEYRQQLEFLVILNSIKQDKKRGKQFLLFGTKASHMLHLLRARLFFPTFVLL